jgi:NADH dehydrogenase
MPEREVNVITGAYGFTGRSIARRLLVNGKKVITLTGHPRSDSEFGGDVEATPFNFDNPAALTDSLRGASVLFNTYWIRFARGDATFERAVENSKILFEAAKAAGVRRLVHVSITNPSIDSDLPYFKGKAELEEFIKGLGISYAILRPAVIFGDQGILINNIAWFLRRSPVFAAPGDGEYKLQPIYVEDLADLAVSLAEKTEDVVTDAIGPEVFTFNELLHLIGRTVHSHTLITHLSPALVLTVTGMIGRLVGDVVLTPDEVKGLHANLLVSSQPPAGRVRLSDWLAENAEWIGTRYMSEVKKHYM